MADERASNASVEAMPLISDVELRSWRAFSEGGQLIEALLDRRLKERVSLSHADYGILRRLQASPEHRLSMRDLRHEVWFSRSRLTHQIKRLEADGLVAKSGDVRDRRRQIVRLTSRGQEVVVEAQRLVRGLLREHFFDQLPAGSVEALSPLLDRMVQHLRRQPECQSFRQS